jgi:undecaprenyl-diphosphatase
MGPSAPVRNGQPAAPHIGPRRGAALKRAWFSLFGPRRAFPQATWTGSMTAMLIAGLVLIVAAHAADADAIRFVRSSASPVIRAMAAVTNVGKSYWYLVPAGVLFLALAFFNWHGRARSAKARLTFFFGQAGYAFLAVAMSGIITDIIKLFVGRARPKFFDTLGTLHFQPFTPGYNFGSFPSGHSTTMGAVAVVLMIWFPRWRLPVFILCVLAACTRVAAQAHYPSDVVAGFVVGTLYSLSAARWLAARGAVFRFEGRRLFPVPRFRRRRRKIDAG